MTGDLLFDWSADLAKRAATSPETATYCSGGRLNWLTDAACWGRSLAEWQNITSPAAAPPAPTGAVLIIPPANGQTAEATVTDLVNEQLRQQQAHNATGVRTYASWQAASAAVSAAQAADDAIAAAERAAADALQSAMPSLWLIGGSVAVLLLLLLIARKTGR